MIHKIGLGGGCHWCTEAIFQHVKGVEQVEQGWISAVEEAGYSEAVIVHYTPAHIRLATLIEIHLQTHSATSNHRLRTKYRSAVYAFTEDERQAAEQILKGLQKDFKAPLITRSLTFGDFKPNTAEFINYYKSDPKRPFCRNIIAPKLRKLVRRFGQVADPAGLQ